MATIRSRSGATAVVDDRYAAQAQAFIDELEATGYDINSLGGYSNRNIAGTNTPSFHAHGAAIDINPDQNPVSFDRVITNLPPNVAEMAAKYGMGWGGNWRGKKDPMHFSFASAEGGEHDIRRKVGSSLRSKPKNDEDISGGASSDTMRGSGGEDEIEVKSKWREPFYDPVGGGSKHSYMFDPETGQGQFKTSSGRVVDYSEPGEWRVRRGVASSLRGGGRRLFGPEGTGALFGLGPRFTSFFGIDSPPGSDYSPLQLQKLEQGGLLDAPRREQLDFLFGDEDEDGGDGFSPTQRQKLELHFGESWRDIPKREQLEFLHPPKPAKKEKTTEEFSAQERRKLEQKFGPEWRKTPRKEQLDFLYGEEEETGLGGTTLNREGVIGFLKKKLANGEAIETLRPIMQKFNITEEELR